MEAVEAQDLIKVGVVVKPQEVPDVEGESNSNLHL